MKNSNEKSVWVEDRLDDLLATIENVIKENQRPPAQVILDDKGVMDVLKISKRTLATLREKQVLNHSKVGGKIYYKLADVLNMIDAHTVASAASLRLGKKRGDYGQAM